jgi:hypothetical protein
VVSEHGIREQKDAMSREVLTRRDRAGIPLASASVRVVGMPPLRLYAA